MFTIIIEYMPSLDQIVKLFKCNVGAGTNAFFAPTCYHTIFFIFLYITVLPQHSFGEEKWVTSFLFDTKLFMFTINIQYLIQ